MPCATSFTARRRMASPRALITSIFPLPAIPRILCTSTFTASSTSFVSTFSFNAFMPPALAIPANSCRAKSFSTTAKAAIDGGKSSATISFSIWRQSGPICALMAENLWAICSGSDSRTIATCWATKFLGRRFCISNGMSIAAYAAMRASR